MTSTKLVGIFKAWRVTIGVKLKDLDKALEHCKELGLIPKVNGYRDRVLFSIILPQTIHPVNFLKNYMGEFDDAVLAGESEVELNCPLSEFQGQEEEALAGTVSDFRNFLGRQLAERMNYLLRSSEAFGDFMVKLNRLGARNIESQPPENVPDIDATVQLSEQELQELETELLQILQSAVSLEFSPIE